METENTKAEESAKTTTSTVSEKLESFKTEASEQLGIAAEILGVLKEEVVTKVNELAAEIDVEGLKTQAADKFQEIKAEANEAAAKAAVKLEELKAEATVELADFKIEAAEKLEELKANAAETLDAAEKKFDELKAEAAEQAEAVKEKAKDIWGKVFGKEPEA